MGRGVETQNFASLPKFGFVLDGEFDQRVAATQIEFLADVGAMVFDGADADAQIIGDLFAGFVLGQQGQHAAFGSGQILQAGLAHQG